MKNPKYVVTALSLAVILSGCGADAAAQNPGATSTAPQTGSASSELSAAPGVDPLDRLPEQPFGLDAEKMIADPAAFGITLNLGTSPDDVPVAGALRTVLQQQWLAEERQIYFGGTDQEKIQGSLRDAERFVAEEALDAERVKAEKGIAFSKKIAAAGEEADLDSDEDLPYPLHLGRIASIASETSNTAKEAQKSPQWEELADDKDSYAWIAAEGEEAAPTPHRISDGHRIVPRIYAVTGPQEGTPSDVHVFAYMDYEFPLLDGRTVVITYSAYYGLVYVEGEWKINSWTRLFNDAEPTMKIKQ